MSRSLTICSSCVCVSALTRPDEDMVSPASSPVGALGGMGRGGKGAQREETWELARACAQPPRTSEKGEEEAMDPGSVSTLTRPDKKKDNSLGISIRVEGWEGAGGRGGGGGEGGGGWSLYGVVLLWTFCVQVEFFHGTDFPLYFPVKSIFGLSALQYLLDALAGEQSVSFRQNS